MVLKWVHKRKRNGCVHRIEKRVNQCPPSSRLTGWNAHASGNRFQQTKRRPHSSVAEENALSLPQEENFVMNQSTMVSSEMENLEQVKLTCKPTGVNRWAKRWVQWLSVKHHLTTPPSHEGGYPIKPSGGARQPCMARMTTLQPTDSNEALGQQGTKHAANKLAP